MLQEEFIDWKNRSLLPRLLYIVQCRNRYRPKDNHIDWWRNYVREFFASTGIVRVSVKDMPVFQQPYSQIPSSLSCTEVPAETLPRLYQFKYENGVQEELLFLGNVIESPLPDGGTSIICYQAAEHLVFDGYAVVQYGHLKVVFNSELKVQLLDFSVTGYDLHLDHSVVHSELKTLYQTLDSKCTTIQQLATQNGNYDQRVIQDALRQTADVVKQASSKLDQYLSSEWTYIQRVLHFMQMADVISNMQLLFSTCNSSTINPIAALQQHGKMSARLPDWLRQEVDLSNPNLNDDDPCPPAAPALHGLQPPHVPSTSAQDSNSPVPQALRAAAAAAVLNSGRGPPDASPCTAPDVAAQPSHGLLTSHAELQSQHSLGATHGLPLVSHQYAQGGRQMLQQQLLQRAGQLQGPKLQRLQTQLLLQNVGVSNMQLQARLQGSPQDLTAEGMS